MKRYLLLISLVFSLSTSAQTGESVRWISKFGLALGFNPVYVASDVTPINNMLPDFGVEKFSDSGFLGFGGSGYVYILLVDNFRIGGMGFAVNSSVNGTPNGLKREAKYSLGIGGISAEYTLPFIQPVAVSIGAIIGSGSMSIELFQNENKLAWDDVWSGFGNSSSRNTRNSKIENSFYTFTPTINIDYPLTRYFALRIGAGYILTFDNEWNFNNDQSLSNVPSNLNADSFFIQGGVYFGFFAF